MVNIKLTARDLKLMRELYLNTFLSFYQIKESHFNKCADSTIYNRLSKLIKGGLIETMRVNILAIHKGNKEVGVIYHLSKKGLRSLKNYSEIDFKRVSPVPINLSQLTHDLILTDVIKRLKTQYRDAEIINSKITGTYFSFNQQVPDAIVNLPDSKIAIEIELTAKSNLRYREIVSNYRTSKEFSEVFYVIKDEAIGIKIASHILGYSASPSDLINADKFRFCTLEDFSNPLSELETLDRRCA